MELSDKIFVTCTIFCVLVLCLQYLNVEINGLFNVGISNVELVSSNRSPRLYLTPKLTQIVGQLNVKNSVLRNILIPLIYPTPKSVVSGRTALSSGTLKVLCLDNNLISSVEFPSLFLDHKRDPFLSVLNQTELVLGSEKLVVDDPIVEIACISEIKIKVLQDNFRHYISEHYITIEEQGDEYIATISSYTASGLRYALVSLNAMLTPVDGTVIPVSVPLIIHDWSENKWRGTCREACLFVVVICKW